MIQRIQSVYMLAAVILLISSMFTSFGAVVKDGIEQTLTSFGVIVNGEQVASSYPLIIAQAISCILVLISIIKFKNRKLQVRLNMMATLACSSVVLLGFYVLDNLPEGETISYGLSIVFPIVAGILLFLASKAIKKDAAILRAADRLR